MAVWSVVFPVLLTFSGTPVKKNLQEPQDPTHRIGDVAKISVSGGLIGTHMEAGYYLKPNHILGLSTGIGVGLSFTKDTVGFAVYRPLINVYWQGFFGDTFFVRSYLGYGQGAGASIGLQKINIQAGQGLSFGCGIGNEWQIEEGFTIGADWLTVHGLLMFDYAQTQGKAHNDGSTSGSVGNKSVGVLPSIEFVKLRLGWSF